jgi:hypothetical protein
MANEKKYSVRVEPWDDKRHAPILREWLSHHKTEFPEETPEIGYMAYLNNTPTAAAFLRRVEGGSGQIDGLTTNPACSSVQRHMAIDAVFENIVDMAKYLRLRGLMFFTVDAGILERSKLRKFTKLSHTVSVLNLKEGAKWLP